MPLKADMSDAASRTVAQTASLRMRYLDMIPLATGVERLPPDIQVAISDPKSSLGVVSAGFHIVMGVSFTARPS